VPPGKIHAAHEIQALLEIGLPLAGEAHDHVGGDGNAGDGGAGGRHQSKILIRGSLASHAAQRGRAARLQRQVQMARQAIVLPQGEEILLQIPGLQGGEPQARDGRLPQDSLDQAFQGLGRLEIAAPRTEMDAGDRCFLCASSMGSPNVGDDFGNRSAAAFPARHRGDAECAAIVAAILRFDEGTRA